MELVVVTCSAGNCRCELGAMISPDPAETSSGLDVGIRMVRRWLHCVWSGSDLEELELESFEFPSVEEIDMVRGAAATTAGLSVAAVGLTSPVGARGFKRLPHHPSLKAFHRSSFSISCTGTLCLYAGSLKWSYVFLAPFTWPSSCSSAFIPRGLFREALFHNWTA